VTFSIPPSTPPIFFSPHRHDHYRRAFGGWGGEAEGCAFAAPELFG